MRVLDQKEASSESSLILTNTCPQCGTAMDPSTSQPCFLCHQSICVADPCLAHHLYVNHQYPEPRAHPAHASTSSQPAVTPPHHDNRGTPNASKNLRISAVTVPSKCRNNNIHPKPRSQSTPGLSIHPNSSESTSSSSSILIEQVRQVNAEAAADLDDLRENMEDTLSHTAVVDEAHPIPDSYIINSHPCNLIEFTALSKSRRKDQRKTVSHKPRISRQPKLTMNGLVSICHQLGYHAVRKTEDLQQLTKDKQKQVLNATNGALMKTKKERRAKIAEPSKLAHRCAVGTREFEACSIVCHEHLDVHVLNTHSVFMVCCLCLGKCTLRD